ncbi:hypothetical protein LEMLEM_LOCUS10468, partial [Lemmus lemmus]
MFPSTHGHTGVLLWSYRCSPMVIQVFSYVSHPAIVIQVFSYGQTGILLGFLLEILLFYTSHSNLQITGNW